MKSSYLILAIILLFQVSSREDVHRHDKDIIYDFEDQVNITVLDKGEDIWSSDWFKQISSKLGLDGKKNITSEDIKYFLSTIVGKVSKGDYEHIVQDLFDTFAKQFPGLTDITGLKQSLTHKNFIDTIKSYFVREPTLYEKLTKGADNSWGSVVQFFHEHFVPKEAAPGFFDNILIKIGLKDKTTLLKEDVRRIVVYLIGDKILGGKYKRQFETIINDFLESLPESIAPADLMKYFTHSRLMKVMNYYFRDVPEVWQNLKYSVFKNWEDFPTFMQNVFENTTDFWESDKFKNILSTLGLEKSTQVTKEDIKNIITSILGEDVVHGKHAQIFKTIFDNFMQNLPDTVKLTDLKNYLPEDNFLRIVMKHFEHEPTLTEKMKDNINVGWNNMKKFFTSVMPSETTGWESSMFNDTISKLGWKSSKKLTKEDIKQFLDQILGTNVFKGEKSIFTEIYDLFLKDFPEQVELKDLKDYLNHNKFFETAKSLFVKEPTNYEKMMNFISTSWDNLGKFFKNMVTGQSDESTMKKIMKDLKLDSKSELTKEDLKNVVNHLLGVDLMTNNTSIFGDFYDTLFKDLPKKITPDKIQNYLNPKNFTSTFTEFYQEKFPRMRDMLGGMGNMTWTAMPTFMQKFVGEMNDTFFEDSSRFWRKSTYEQAFKDLGFDKKDEITRDEFKKFVVRVFFDTNKDIKLSGVVQEVFDSYINNIPKPIKTSKIESYLDFEKFIKAAKVVAEKHFGKTSMEKFKSFFELPTKSISSLLQGIFNYTHHEEL